MAGSLDGVQGFATGIFVSYWIKLGIAAYLIAYHQFGFRLPSLPFDLAYVFQAIS